MKLIATIHLGLPTGVTALSMAIFWDNYGVGKM